MKTVNRILNVNVWILLIIAVILVIMLSGCGEYEPDEMEVDTTENISVNITDDEQQSSNKTIEEVPFVKNDPRYTSKLDNKLVELIDAYERGVAAEYADIHGIKIQDDSILVTITSMPGQTELAKEAALIVGANIIAIYKDWIDIIIPIGNLLELSQIESISIINLPIEDIPQ
jgi:hypothetical protein